MNWTLEIRNGTRRMICGRFKITQNGGFVELKYKSILLCYPNMDIAKRVAYYLFQGGMPS